jgi:hypothetical protein
MWNIIQVNASTPSQTSILFGGVPGKEAVGPTNRLGPEGAAYVLAFPGVGYIKLTDVGSNGEHFLLQYSVWSIYLGWDAGTGPGSWKVAVSGSSTNWTYEGDGQATVSVDSEGHYTISGGSNTVSGSV